MPLGGCENAVLSAVGEGGPPARRGGARAEGAFQKGPVVELPPPRSERGPVVVKSTADCGRALQALREARGRAGKLFAVTCELDRQGEGAQLVCFTIHGGEDVDFGGSSTLWVDAVSISEEVGQPSALACFREFFEDEGYHKVYHNYSTLNSALRKHEVSHLGFAGDTMHIARVWDASLTFLQDEGASLQKLVGLCLGGEYERGLAAAAIRKKDGRLAQRPLSLQSGAETRGHWIDFAACAATCVFHLYRDLRARLRATRCRPISGTPPGSGTMWEFYDKFWRPFGQVLAAMERRGLGTDIEHLRALEADVARERAPLEAAVRGWAADATSERFGPSEAEGANLHALNTSSDVQIRHLLFGGQPNKSPSKGSLPDEKILPGVAPTAEEAGPTGPSSAAPAGVQRPPTPAGDGAAAAADYGHLKVPELKELLRSRGLPVTGTKAVLVERLLLQDQGVEQKMAPKGKQKAPSVRIRGLRLGLKAVAYTDAGWPSVSGEMLRAMAKQQGNKGKGALGWDSVSTAMSNLAELKELDGKLDFFLRPLQDHVQANGRIHSSFNLNTETGRLSSRDPNLQNQPAGNSLVRKAFVAAEGNALVVADYAQLELRVLAHLAGCQSWVEALNSGGDFHSKTAAKMFPKVRDAVERGIARLDGEGDSHGQSLPTVKESFPLERGRAKTLNFAILYGKSAWGLSQDWGIEIDEAQKIINDWFGAYPEIQQWQDRMREEAIQTGGVRTLLGRFRRLPGVHDRQSTAKRNHALRAAINTPVQGSAADIVTLAMLRLASCKYLLHELGFHMVHQVHDEVLLEGPEGQAENALWQVRRLMEDPLPFGMAARLVVDARTGRNWYDAKSD